MENQEFQSVFYPTFCPIVSLVQAYPNSIGQVYLADRGAVRLGINPETVDDNAKIIENSVKRFVREFFSDIEDRVSVSREVPGENLERSELVSTMASILEENGDKQIISFAKSRNGFKSLKYLAEHSLYMRDKVTDNSNLFLVKNPTKLKIQLSMKTHY